MNAVIYARYSSDSQREESIEGQLSNLIRPFRSKKRPLSSGSRSSGTIFTSEM